MIWAIRKWSFKALQYIAYWIMPKEVTSNAKLGIRNEQIKLLFLVCDEIDENRKTKMNALKDEFGEKDVFNYLELGYNQAKDTVKRFASELQVAMENGK